QLICGVEIAAEIVRQQHEADDHAPDYVAENHLQECEIGVVGEAWDADDGERAGFGGNDRERNRPPGNVAIGQKVIAQRTLLLAEAQSEQSDAYQVKGDDSEVEAVEAHLGA